ncbi:hypothetical protein MNBD_GAMMA22-2406 [hydrothermal vent metagenome]|uniref:HTH cro/C1-type domain-containing protein n=1 Tax=hydrothermal vent metagenome TaxID=652676 RepID=A0A3B0ZKH9_9ZZZZ
MKKTLHTEHSEIIAQALVTIRNKAGLTQRELAERLKRNHSIIGQYELGQRRVDLAEFYWICLACEVAPHLEASKLMKAFAKLKK